MAFPSERPPQTLAREHPESFFEEVVVFLWRCRWMLLMGLILGIATGVGLYRVMPKVYESSAKFIIDDLPFNIRETGSDAETERQLVQTLIMSIPSQDMREAVARQLEIDPKRLAFEEIDRRLSLRGSLPTANIRVASTKNSRIGAITCQSQDAAFAAQIANAVLKELNVLNLVAGELKSAKQNNELARNKADQLLKQLVQISGNRVEFETQVMELDDYLKRKLPIEDFPAFSQDATLNNLKTQLIIVEGEYDSTAANSTKGARLEGKRAELRGLRSQTTAQAKALATALRSRLSIARFQEEDLQKQIGVIESQISQTERQSSLFLSNFGDSSRIHQLLAEQKEAPAETGNVIVTVNPAKQEIRSVKPKLTLNVMLGAMLGLGLGLGLALVGASLDTRIRSPGQIRSETGTPCLCVLPRPDLRRNKRDRNKLLDMPPPSQGLGFLRNFLLRDNLNRKDSPILAFVPASEDAAASTLVSDLAILLAQAEKRTLVIDLHTQNPQQAQLLGIEPKTGLSDWLLSDDSLDAFIAYSVVRELAVLDVGRSQQHLDELFSRRPLAPALTNLSSQWDFIIIDSPPLRDDWNLLLALPPAASIISISLYRKTRFDELRRLIRQTAEANWNYLGTILQNVPRAR